MSNDDLTQTPLGADGAFEVHLAKRGEKYRVPADQSILRVLSDAGVDVPFACEQGVCGTCLTKVLAGQPDHWDMFLTPEEQEANTQMMICCSRSQTAVLVLDI